MNIIDEAGSLSTEIKAKQKNLDSLKTQIKELPSSELTGADFVAKISTRITKAFKQEALLEKVKEAGAFWLIKEVVDLDKLEDSIAQGEIDGALFQDCISYTESKVLSFRRKKR